MADSNVTVKASELMNRITINCRLTGIRGLSARIRIGIVFIKLAARIMGCGIKVDFDGGYPPLVNPLPPMPTEMGK